MKSCTIQIKESRGKRSMEMSDEYFFGHLFARLLPMEAEEKAQIYEPVADLKLVYYVDLSELFGKQIDLTKEQVSRPMIHAFCSEEMDEEFIFPFLRITALQTMYLKLCRMIFVIRCFCSTGLFMRMCILLNSILKK